MLDPPQLVPHRALQGVARDVRHPLLRRPRPILTGSADWSRGMIRVVVAADIRLYRDGLRDGLDGLRDVVVVAAESSVAAVLAAVDRLRPEVAVVDLAMVGGASLLRDLGSRGVKLVALTVPEAAEAMLTCAEA